MSLSSAEKFIIVNYHYVEDPRPDFSGIHPCPVREFERQVGYLAKNYMLTSVPELFRAAQEGRSGTHAAITFDDGLRDQLEYAVPVLRNHKAPATFFFITGTLEGFVPLAHKIHLLSSRMGMVEIARAFNAFLKESFPDVSERYDIPNDRRLTADRRLHEDIISANVKEMLILIPQKIRDDFFRTVASRVIGEDEAAIAGRLFMSGGEMQKLDREGFVIGSHTHYHESLERRDEAAFREDTAKAQKVFFRYLGKTPAVISYPHGRSNDATKRVLEEFRFTHGVTIERRGITAGDDPFAIPRFDTTDMKVFLDTVRVP